MAGLSDNSGFLDKVQKFVKDIKRESIDAAVYAHSYTASLAAQEIKEKISERHGSKPGKKDYQTSPAGSLPYMHSGRLRRSIGFKVFLKGTLVESEMGSGAMGVTPVLYGRYIEKIRPYLWVGGKVYNAEEIAKIWAKKMNEGK